MVAQIVNFAILFFILGRFVYKPVMRLLDERQEKIARTEAEKRAAGERLAAIESEREKMLAEARAESVRIIEAGKQSGEEVRKKILVAGQEEAARIKADGEKRIAGERSKLISDVRREVGTLVVDAIDKAFGDVLDERSQGRMVEQALAILREAQKSKNP